MKVAIYCRLSEEDRNKQFETDDSNSIQNQKAMLLQYAMEQGWELYNIYSDDDYTGSDRRRPEFNRLLKDAEQHRFDIILCKTQSRFTRELELVEKYIHGLGLPQQLVFAFTTLQAVYHAIMMIDIDAMRQRSEEEKALVNEPDPLNIG